MADPVQVQDQEEMVGPRRVIKRIEFVKVITGALYALGYKRAGACLEDESGIPLRSVNVNLLIQYVLEGKCDEGASLLHEIGLEDETMRCAKFLLYEQKFLELLNDGKTTEALNKLRTEISPLDIRTTRVRELSFGFLFNHLQNDHWENTLRTKSYSEVLDELNNLLPHTIMPPEGRLEHLLEHALYLQQICCVFHNSSNWDMPLYIDHKCGRAKIPPHTVQVLTEHADEVSFMQFSHKGKYLATASRDETVNIWEVVADDKLVLKHKLDGHYAPVCQVAWSPDDKQIITCGAEECVKRWDILTGDCLDKYEKPGVPTISCAWSPDGKTVYAGCNNSSICEWDLDGDELECWYVTETLKTSDLQVTGDGKVIMSMCGETEILLLNMETNDVSYIDEEQTITSFVLSEDSKVVLINLVSQEISLWSIENNDIGFISMYNGHSQSGSIVRSCFGGSKQAFIASGSEDSQVYIWRRDTRVLMDRLQGHSGVVNCVSWNPTNPNMLASAGDDGTVRIWNFGTRH